MLSYLAKSKAFFLGPSGLWFLKPGDKLWAVEKAMGLKKGEKIKRLGLIEVVSVRSETLATLINNKQYGNEEVKREGYPFGRRNGSDFAFDLARKSKKPIYEPINRIEFKRIAA